MKNSILAMWKLSLAISLRAITDEPLQKGKKYYAMKAYGGVDVQIHVFLTLALTGVEWSASRPCRFTPGTHLIGG
jgi:hypothetical protein